MRTVGLTMGVRKEALHDCTTSVGTRFAQLVQLRKQGDRDKAEKTSGEDKQRRQAEKKDNRGNIKFTKKLHVH